MLDTIPSILVVDDSASSRQMIAEILVNFEAKLIFSDEGYQVLKQLESQVFDLFIIDINMPHIDGITLTKKIRKLPEYTNTPILMVTALAQQGLITSAFEAGANDFVSKPVNYHELNARVSNLIQKYLAEKQVETLLSQMKNRNDELIDTNRQLQTFIEQLKADLIVTENKLNKLLISLSESATKNADLIGINQHLGHQIKQLHGKNTELQVMLDNRFNSLSDYQSLN